MRMVPATVLPPARLVDLLHDRTERLQLDDRQVRVLLSGQRHVQHGREGLRPHGVADLGGRLREEHVAAEGRRAAAAARGAKAEAEANRDNDTDRTRQLGLLNGQLSQLNGRIASARVVDPRQQPAEEVRFGATVTLRPTAGPKPGGTQRSAGSTAAERRFTIVGVEEASVAEGKVAFVGSDTLPLAQGREREAGQANRLVGRAERSRGPGVFLHCRRQPMQALHLVEGDLAVLAAYDALEHEIARAKPGVERGERRLGLRDDPGPAPLVEELGDVVGHRVACADVDVEPGRLAREGQGDGGWVAGSVTEAMADSMAGSMTS